MRKDNICPIHNEQIPYPLKECPYCENERNYRERELERKQSTCTHESIVYTPLPDIGGEYKVCRKCGKTVE